MRGWDEHHLLAERLKRAACRWILSSYDIPEMHTLFPEHYILGVQSASGMNTQKNGSTRTTNREVLITNFPPPKVLLISPKETPKAQPTLEMEAKAAYGTPSTADFVLLNSPSEGLSPANRVE